MSEEFFESIRFSHQVTMNMISISITMSKQIKVCGNILIWFEFQTLHRMVALLSHLDGRSV